MRTRLHPRATAALLLAAALACVPAARPADTPAVVETGVIHGAKFAIALPTVEWNKRLLIVAHGYRPEGTPLVADLNPSRAAFRQLLSDGWMIATTSYRRNGMIVADAIADLDALRSYVASAHGEPERVLIEGDSLGGLIATIIAERDKGAYDGAVVFDATLYLRDPTSQVGLTLLPRIPLLFVATARESAQAKSYITSLVARPAPVIQPVLFLISRVGHTNINQAERLEAVQAMNLWLDNGREALPRPRDQAPYFDATLPADPGPSTAEVSPDAHTIETKVAEIDPVYGSVLLEAQPEDFAAAGIRPMSFCTLSARGKRFRILFGQSYGDVKDGQWIVFPDADGRTLVSQGHTSAAATSGLSVGDPVTLKLVMPGDPPSG